MNILITALAAAALLQTAPAPEPQISDADAQKALELTQEMIFILGSCEAAFPPEVSAAFAEQLATEADQEVAALLKASYDAGKASPKAATQTVQSCVQELQVITAQVEAFASQLSQPAN